MLIVVSGLSLLSAQSYNISVNPTTIMPSWYDYMIGGYNATPVQVVPSEQGGGVMMAFHGKSASGAIRKSYVAYVDSTGLLQSCESLSVQNSTNGYPSIAIDEESGLVFVAWHNQIGSDINTSVYGAFSPLHTMPVFSSTIAGESYLWPTVKFGPSPTLGMRRLYVMAKRNVSNSIQVPRIAYCDFDPELVEENTELTWNYLTIPELEEWAANTTIRRIASYSLVIGDNGSIYLVGNHSTEQISPAATIDEPNLDVFKCDNFGTGIWSRTSIHAEQGPSMPYPEIESPMLADIVNSSHFNAVLDASGNIHFSQLAGYGWTEGNTALYMSDSQALRHIEYDTASDIIKINDLYPQGASPHESPAYTPWDINEDGIIDELSPEGYPIYPRTWPFPYWDSTVHSNAMFYHYNKLMMTEPNQYGWMATVWQDSNKARNAENPPGFPCSEIFVSLSTDNGRTWLEPFIISEDYQIAMAGIKPMWVYPANKMTIQSLEGGNLTCRLYLMFYDDNTWGAYNVSDPVGTDGSGTVMYMAVDIAGQITSNQDELVVPQLVTLSQNYPNPFNPSTEIKYSFNEAGKVNLSIYNTKGQLVKTLVNSKVKVGAQSISWNGKDENGRQVSSGLYLYKLSTNDKSISRKMLMLK